MIPEKGLTIMINLLQNSKIQLSFKLLAEQILLINESDFNCHN